jgi:hypothetical protein
MHTPDWLVILLRQINGRMEGGPTRCFFNVITTEGGKENFCNLNKQVDIKHNLNYDVIPSGMEET